MSSDSDNPKNDPLFERLFAEAEACLEKKRKIPDSNRAKATGVSPEQPVKEGIEGQAPRLRVQSESASKSPRERLTREGGLSLNGFRPRPSIAEKSPDKEATGQPKHAEALQHAEAKIEKLQGRLTTIKERAKRDQQLALSKQTDKIILGFLQLIDDLERALGASVEEGQTQLTSKPIARASNRSTMEGSTFCLNMG